MNALICITFLTVVGLSIHITKVLSSTVVHENVEFPEWNFFKKIHKKHYSNVDEEKKRRDIFKTELSELKNHNRLFKQGAVSFKRSVNKLSDQTLDEFIGRYNGFRSDLAEPHIVTTLAVKHANFRSTKTSPPRVDWRERGVNTPVKDQEFCRACWAFVAAAALEAHELIVHDREVELSEQNLIDCAESNFNAGCLGGHMIRAFNYTRSARGLSHRLYYPYEKIKKVCRLKDVFNVGTYAISYKRLPIGDEKELERAVAFIGPVAAAIYGNLQSLKSYSSGIFYDENCNSTMISHAVLIVGYGTDYKGQDYWLIKNSLGIYWGERGYLRLARNRNNHCGIATDAVYPIINQYPPRRYQSSTPSG